MDDDNKELAVQNRPSRLTIKLGPLNIDMKNTPQMAFIIVAIGLCFLLVLIGMNMLEPSDDEGLIKNIVTRVLEDEPITTTEVASIEKMSLEEKEELLNKLIAEARAIEAAKPVMTLEGDIPDMSRIIEPDDKKKEVVLPIEGGAVLRIEQSAIEGAPVQITREEMSLPAMKASYE